MTTPDCLHESVRDGKCVDCGICTHDVILNGVCFYCGSSDVKVDGPKSKSPPLVTIRKRK
jgi:hypothetical protein